MVNKFSKGDIININFDPQTGHEQKGWRPAIVASNIDFNSVTCFCFVCPITRTDRKNPLHVRLDERTKTTGVILCDQMRSLDVTAREASFIEKAPDDIVVEMTDIIVQCL